jgi:hypothetical protein
MDKKIVVMTPYFEQWCFVRIYKGGVPRADDRGVFETYKNASAAACIEPDGGYSTVEFFKTYNNVYELILFSKFIADYKLQNTWEDFMMNLAKTKYKVGNKFRIAHMANKVRTIRDFDKKKQPIWSLGVGFTINTVEPGDANYSALIYTEGRWSDIFESVVEEKEVQEVAVTKGTYNASLPVLNPIIYGTGESMEGEPGQSFQEFFDFAKETNMYPVPSANAFRLLNNYYTGVSKNVPTVKKKAHYISKEKEFKTINKY